MAALADCGSPTVAVPVFNGDELAGFILYGVHRDGTRLDPDEVALLETLAESAGQAYVRVENPRLRALVGSAVQPSDGHFPGGGERLALAVRKDLN